MKRRLARIGRIVRYIAMGVAGFAVVLGAAFGFSTYMVHAGFEAEATLPADCAVVFGAAVYGLSQPGPAIVRRVTAAADLYRGREVNRLILTGGMGTGNRETEAGVMRKQAMMRGVPPDAITLEEESHSTQENIEFSTPLIQDCESIVVVSDAYHLARIKLLAWRQGWDSVGTVAPETRPPAESEQRSVTREVLAYMYYLLYIDVLLPNIPAYLGYEASGT